MERQPSYQDLDNEVLETLLSIRRKTLGLLEQQRATFGSLHVAPHIIHSIENEEGEIAAIKAELKARGRDSQLNLMSDKFVQPALDALGASAKKSGQLEEARGQVTAGLAGLITTLGIWLLLQLTSTFIGVALLSNELSSLVRVIIIGVLTLSALVFFILLLYGGLRYINAYRKR